jgi:hypothetical protein
MINQFRWWYYFKMGLFFSVGITAIILITELVFIFTLFSQNALDGRFCYSVAEISTLFNTIGEAGRNAYFHREMVDCCFLASYTFFILFWMNRLYRSRKKPLPVGAILLGLLPGFLDLIETSGVMILLKQYPDMSQWLATTLTFATPLKWMASLPLTWFFIDRLRNL